jgi:hypothetical protein
MTSISTTMQDRDALTAQTPFPKEIAGSQNCDHGFLPLLGDDRSS